jgi:hypothetical protein
VAIINNLEMDHADIFESISDIQLSFRRFINLIPRSGLLLANGDEPNLAPLLADLSNNRPLRLELPGVFTELPVPPFVVAEWRSLPDWREPAS